MHLVREADPDLVEHVEDRIPAVREVLVARVDSLLRHRREHRDVLPDTRPGEAHDGLDAELRGESRGVLHLLGRSLTYPFRVTVAPHLIGEDVAVALIDRVVAHGLALEVVRDGPDLESMPLEQVELALHVLVVVPAPRVEVVAPAGDLESVVAPLCGEPGDLLERQVGPLAGEEGDGSRHCECPSDVIGMDEPADQSPVGVQALPASELRSTASSTRWTWSPSANEGRGWAPSAIAVTKSKTWCEKPCS